MGAAGSAELIKGGPLASALRQQVMAAVDGADVVPRLVNIVAGELGASAAYLDSLDKAAAKRGLDSRRLLVEGDVTEGRLIETVRGACADPTIHGVMVQLPLPEGIDASRVTETIAPAKDVDGQTTASLGAVLAGRRQHTAPATAAAVVELLASDPRLDPAGRHVVIVGRSLVVGRPLAAMLTAKGPGGNATVSVCHTGTPDLGAFTRLADIIVVAAGRRHMLTPDMVRPGAIVVDVGTHAVEGPDGPTLAGDAHPDVAAVAGFLTPVPGGVGTVTTALLLRHVAAAALPERFAAAW